jgi:hypothetical protein
MLTAGADAGASSCRPLFPPPRPGPPCLPVCLRRGLIVRARLCSGADGASANHKSAWADQISTSLQYEEVRAACR